MKIYLVINEDRHCDVGVYPYYDKEKAIERAKSIADDGCRGYQEDIEIDNCEGDKDGWIINIIYSCEGDKVRVEESEL